MRRLTSTSVSLRARLLRAQSTASSSQFASPVIVSLFSSDAGSSLASPSTRSGGINANPIEEQAPVPLPASASGQSPARKRIWKDPILSSLDSKGGPAAAPLTTFAPVRHVSISNSILSSLGSAADSSQDKAPAASLPRRQLQFVDPILSSISSFKSSRYGSALRCLAPIPAKMAPTTDKILASLSVAKNSKHLMKEAFYKKHVAMPDSQYSLLLRRIRVWETRFKGRDVDIYTRNIADIVEKATGVPVLPAERDHIKLFAPHLKVHEFEKIRAEFFHEENYRAIIFSPKYMFEKGLQQQLSDCSKFSSGDVVSFKNPTTALNIQGMISTTSKKNSYIIFNDFPHIFQHKFFLDNIPAECSESDLLTYFSRFGTVVAVEIFKERLYVPEVSEKARIPKVIAKDASSETSNNSDEAATLTTAVAPDSQQEASDVSLENADSSICTSTGEEQEVLNETDPIPNASSPTEITLEESSKKDCSGARVEDMSDAQIKNKKKFAPVAKKRKTSAKRRNRSRLMQTPKQIPTSGIYAAIYFKDRACLSDLLSEDVRLLGFSLMDCATSNPHSRNAVFRRCIATKPSSTLYIGNLPFNIHGFFVEDLLYAALNRDRPFEGFRCCVQTDKFNVGTGSILVDFNSHQQAVKAMRILCFEDISGRPLVVGWVSTELLKRIQLKRERKKRISNFLPWH